MGPFEGPANVKPPALPEVHDFWREAKQTTDAIVVSHRVQRKVSGPLHAQTYYGDTGQEVTEGGITYRYFVFRKPLEKISASEVENIRDHDRLDCAGGDSCHCRRPIYNLVKKHLDKHGGDPKKAFGENNYPLLVGKSTGETREVKKVRLLVKRQAKVMRGHRPSPGTFVEVNNLHHIAIYDNRGQPQHETVTLFEALRRAHAGEPLFRQSNSQEGRLVMSLCPHDILEVKNSDGSKEYLLVRKFNEKGRVFYKPVNMADDPKPEVSFGPARFFELGIRKVTVDPIGRVRPAHD